MKAFSEQTVFCQGCGNPFKTAFQKYGGRVCSAPCFDILEKKKTRSIIGKEENPEDVQVSKAQQSLNLYLKSINNIDDFFEYGNESKSDRNFIKVQLNNLTEQLKSVYNTEKKD